MLSEQHVSQPTRVITVISPALLQEPRESPLPSPAKMSTARSSRLIKQQLRFSDRFETKGAAEGETSCEET